MSETQRFLWGAFPIALVCLIHWALGLDTAPSTITVVGTFAISAAILWFGWRAVRRNVVTRWLGIFVAVYLGLFLGIFAIGIAVRFAAVLAVAFLVAAPFVFYDLFFRAPFQGRFARARAARMHARS